MEYRINRPSFKMIVILFKLKKNQLRKINKIN